jgi:hypothetical protein
MDVCWKQYNVGNVINGAMAKHGVLKPTLDIEIALFLEIEVDLEIGTINLVPNSGLMGAALGPEIQDDLGKEGALIAVKPGARGIVADPEHHSARKQKPTGDDGLGMHPGTAAPLEGTFLHGVQLEKTVVSHLLGW